MLSLKRSVGQVIRIGNDVELRVLQTTGGQVRIGISAPRDVKVDRAEVHRTTKDRKPK